LLPYAIRECVGADRPRTVYRFSALPQANDAETMNVIRRLKHATVPLAEAISAVVLDSEGFPVRGGTKAADGN